jgi:hypothetical protein
MFFQLVETSASGIISHSETQSPFIDGAWIFLVKSRSYELWKDMSGLFQVESWMTTHRLSIQPAAEIDATKITSQTQSRHERV